MIDRQCLDREHAAASALPAWLEDVLEPDWRRYGDFERLTDSRLRTRELLAAADRALAELAAMNRSAAA
ncbi:MAG: hypothetical protein ABSC56_00375 [Solirubrobacteraceae bacterium]